MSKGCHHGSLTGGLPRPACGERAGVRGGRHVGLPASAQPTAGASSPPSWPSPLKGEGTLDSSTIPGKKIRFSLPTKLRERQIFSPIRGKRASDFLPLPLWERAGVRGGLHVGLSASAQPTVGASSPPSWPSPIKGEGTLDSSTIRGKENQIFSPNEVTRASNFLSQRGYESIRFSLPSEGREPQIFSLSPRGRGQG
jgi:hypothetical protein